MYFLSVFSIQFYRKAMFVVASGLGYISAKLEIILNSICGLKKTSGTFHCNCHGVNSYLLNTQNNFDILIFFQVVVYVSLSLQN